MNGCKAGAQKLKYMYLGRDLSVKKVCMKAIQKVHAFNIQLNFNSKPRNLNLNQIRQFNILENHLESKQDTFFFQSNDHVQCSYFIVADNR